MWSRMSGSESMEQHASPAICVGVAFANVVSDFFLIRWTLYHEYKEVKEALIEVQG